MGGVSTGPLLAHLVDYGPDEYPGDSHSFTLSNDGCTDRSLAPGERCALGVEFHPESPGAKYARLRVDGPDAIYTIVSMNGVASALTASPSKLDFGQLAKGSSAAATVTVAARDGANGYIQDVSIGQPAGSPKWYSIESDGCLGATLAPGQSCSFAVRFVPQGVGPAPSGLELNVESTDGSFALVELAGAGM